MTLALPLPRGALLLLGFRTGTCEVRGLGALRRRLARRHVRELLHARASDAFSLTHPSRDRIGDGP